MKSTQRSKSKPRPRPDEGGRLKIGDDWNAIRIIGLLSFWTVGETLTMSSTGADNRAYQMVMSKGEPRYTVGPRRALFSERGTELKVSPLLEGIRSLSGEKIQWYLASELRDRVRH